MHGKARCRICSLTGTTTTTNGDWKTDMAGKTDLPGLWTRQPDLLLLHRMWALDIKVWRNWGRFQRPEENEWRIRWAMSQLRTRKYSRLWNCRLRQNFKSRVYKRGLRIGGNRCMAWRVAHQRSKHNPIVISVGQRRTLKRLPRMIQLPFGTIIETRLWKNSHLF